MGEIGQGGWFNDHLEGRTNRTLGLRPTLAVLLWSLHFEELRPERPIEAEG